MNDRRRTPRQERSRATREAIVEAAARVFAEVGLEQATTARIAEVAGVSPGSMYQYFPSKDALVTALFDREVEAQNRAFLAMAAEIGVEDTPRLIRGVVDWMVRHTEEKKDLNRVLLTEVPRVSGLEHSRAVDHLAASSVRMLLELAKERLEPRDLDVAAVLVVRAFRYAIIPLITEPLDARARETFVDELSDLIATYLLVPRPWRRP